VESSRWKRFRRGSREGEEGVTVLECEGHQVTDCSTQLSAYAVHTAQSHGIWHAHDQLFARIKKAARDPAVKVLVTTLIALELNGLEQRGPYLSVMEIDTNPTSLNPELDMPPYTSRKYVDIILRASSKWGTLEPFSRKIETGDFGKIDEHTGEFEYRGNIYDDEEILDFLPEIGDEKYKPIVSEPIGQLIIAGGKCKYEDINPDAEINSHGKLADASIKTQFRFEKGVRGAFLVMYRPQSTDLPKDILLHKLHDLRPLKGMFLVTSSIACPAYALGLADTNSDIVRVAFLGKLPPAEATPSASANTNIGWITDHKTGLYQEGCDLGGGFKYGPLYTLKQMRNTKGWLPDFRDSPGPQRFGDDLWIPAQTPWVSLDENGEEEEFYDEIVD